MAAVGAYMLISCRSTPQGRRGIKSMEQPRFRSRSHRARSALEQWAAAHPNIWRLVDELRDSNHRDRPSYVFLPLERAAAIIGAHAATLGKLPKRVGDLVVPGSMLAMFSAWRLTQGIYRYDPALYEAVVATTVNGEIPSELLQHLPEWCVYLETPDMTTPLCEGRETQLHGVWAWIDWSHKDKVDALFLGLDTEERIEIAQIPLAGTLQQSLARVEAEWRSALLRGIAPAGPPSGYAEAATRAFAPILSLLLYLCSEAVDLGDVRRKPSNPQPKRTRHGWRLFPADSPTTWDVGVRIGAALRRAYRGEDMARDSVSTGRHVRPHVRRAHWHTFLTGPQRGGRRVKWLPPIAINVDDPDSLPATIRNVNGP
jgi:hypothetical protein